MRQYIAGFMLLMALLSVLPMHAQENNCYQLNPDDCTLFYGAMDASGTLESDMLSFSGEFRLTGFPKQPDIFIPFDGSAAFDINPAALREAQQAVQANAGTRGFRETIELFLRILQNANVEL